MLYDTDSVTDTVVVPRPGHVGDLATIRVSTVELGPRLGRHTVAALVGITWPRFREPAGEEPDATQQRAVLAAMLKHIATAMQAKPVKVQQDQLERARVNLERYIAVQKP